MISVLVANTDNAWFDFLSSEGNPSEVDFWSPGEISFRALQPGEMLAFRLKSPRNKIGGFGIFSSYSRLPIQMAWETFGRGNGVSSFEGLRSAIAQLRTNIAVLPSTNIGSTVLVQPVFSLHTSGLTYPSLGHPAFNGESGIRQTMPRAFNCGSSF
jgi:putative restriction endonuclease